MDNPNDELKRAENALASAKQRQQQDDNDETRKAVEDAQREVDRLKQNK